MQSLGRTINTITNQNELATNLAKEVETALNSFDFREKVVPRTDNKNIDSAINESDKVLAEVNSVNNEVMVDQIEINKVMVGLVIMYERLKELRTELLLAATETTSKRAQKDLNKQIVKLNTCLLYTSPSPRDS